MYLMESSRICISHEIGVVSRYIENPGEEHWTVVKWVVWYLTSTSAYYITNNGCSDLVYGYVDLVFVDVLDKIKSTSSYVTYACKEAMCLKGLLGKFRQVQYKVNGLCGSQSIVHLDNKLCYHNETKHIAIKHHFVRHVIHGGGVVPEKIHAQENHADMFTKLVLLEKLWWCLASLGLQER